MSSLRSLHFDEIIIVLVHDDPLQIMDKIPALLELKKKKESVKWKRSMGDKPTFL